MSATKAAVKKAAPAPAPVAEPEASAAEARAAIADIMASATISAAEPSVGDKKYLGLPVITVSERDLTGKSALGERTAENQGQADFIPGTKNTDMLYIPDFVEDERTGIARRLLRKDEYHYIWVSHELITSFRANGYKFVQYEGGPQSGLVGDGFKHTGFFERSIDNRVMLGDTYLMYIPIRQYEAIVAAEREELDALNAPLGQMRSEGSQRGIRTFVEGEDGKLVYD